MSKMPSLIVFLALFCVPLAAQQRIISLAPHTTELIYALGAGNRLVAVSDYSNYPQEAVRLSSVANHNGVNFEKIIRLKPDLIVAWQGGNKPQDLAKLTSLGFSLYLSNPQRPIDVAQDMQSLGERIGKAGKGKELSDAFITSLNKLKAKYASQPKVSVFYYLWATPMMTIGKDAWASHLLTLCGATNIFADSVISYPQVNIEQIARRHPQKIIAAINISLQDAKTFWQAKRGVITAPMAVTNPDVLHRFTPRLLDGLRSLCELIHTNGEVNEYTVKPAN
ncbi:MAG: vitamin B12 transport system substrate-binding protein [Paraglaciecola sp.]|jgi:vitamin B12 transport system substrate-binding protein